MGLTLKKSVALLSLHLKGTMASLFSFLLVMEEVMLESECLILQQVDASELCASTSRFLETATGNQQVLDLVEGQGSMILVYTSWMQVITELGKAMEAEDAAIIAF
jgi:hypothetical protein